MRSINLAQAFVNLLARIANRPQGTPIQEWASEQWDDYLTDMDSRSKKLLRKQMIELGLISDAARLPDEEQEL